MSSRHLLEHYMPNRHTSDMSRNSGSQPEKKPPEPELTDEQLRAIGERVRVAREIKKLTQGTLAKEVGVGQDYVSRLETGKRAASLAVLLGIARALEQEVGWIANDEGPGPVARAPVAFDQRDRRKRKPSGQ